MALCDDCRVWLACRLEECYVRDVGKSFPHATVQDFQDAYFLSLRHDIPDAATEQARLAPVSSDAGETQETSSDLKTTTTISEVGNKHAATDHHPFQKRGKKSFWVNVESERNLASLRDRMDSCRLCCWLFLVYRGRNRYQRIKCPLPDRDGHPLTDSEINKPRSYEDARMIPVTLELEILLDEPENSHPNLDVSFHICPSKGRVSHYKLRLQGASSSLPDYRSDSALKRRYVFEYILHGRDSASRVLEMRHKARWLAETQSDGERHARCDPSSLLCTCRLNRIRDWLETCRASHPLCRRKPSSAEGKSSLPARLIVVGQTSEEVRLIDTATMDVGRQVQYATLSHCWGAEPFLTLTYHNHEQFKNAIPVSSLARTFREAIGVCRALGLDYLWIDCLCIIQDPSDESDWRREAPRMNHVYGNSALNLSATASSNPQEGLVRPNNDVLLDALQIELPNGITLVEDLYSSSSSHLHVYRTSPLLERGWIVQECFMAPRLLHFADLEVYWQCKQATYSDTNHSIDDSRPSNSLVAARGVNRMPLFYFSTIDAAKSTEELDAIWAEVAADYSQTLVTRPRDRYYALAGLAAAVHTRYKQIGTNTRYVAGVWEHDILRMLLWKGMSDFRPSAGPDMVIPSWSWLQRKYLLNDRDLSDYRDPDPDSPLSIRVEGIDVAYADDGFCYGPVKLASLRLEGLFFEYEDFNYSSTGRLFLGGRVTPALPIQRSKFYEARAQVWTINTGGDRSVPDEYIVHSAYFTQSEFNLFALVVQRTGPDGDCYRKKGGINVWYCPRRIVGPIERREYERDLKEVSRLLEFFQEENLPRRRITLV